MGIFFEEEETTLTSIEAHGLMLRMHGKAFRRNPDYPRQKACIVDALRNAKASAIRRWVLAAQKPKKPFTNIKNPYATKGGE